MSRMRTSVYPPFLGAEIASQQTAPASDPGTQACWDLRYDWADINADGLIDFFDVDPYLGILFAPSAISRVFTWDAENRLLEDV